jgi:hypothetical protein
MVFCTGVNTKGQFLILETDKGIKLDFQGRDAKKFAQVHTPKKPRETVVFALDERYLRTAFSGFLPKKRRAQ